VRAIFISVMFIVMLPRFMITFAIKLCVRSCFSGTVHLTGYVVADVEEELFEVLVQCPASGDTVDKSDSNEVPVDEPYNAETKQISKNSGLKGNFAAKQPFCVAIGWIGSLYLHTRATFQQRAVPVPMRPSLKQARSFQQT